MALDARRTKSRTENNGGRRKWAEPPTQRKAILDEECVILESSTRPLAILVCFIFDFRIL